MSQGRKSSPNLRKIWDAIDELREDDVKDRSNQNERHLMPIGSERSAYRKSNVSKIKFGYPDIETSWNNSDGLALNYQENETRPEDNLQDSTSSMFPEMSTLQYQDVRKQLFKSRQTACDKLLDDSFAASPMQSFTAQKDETEMGKLGEVYHCPSNYQKNISTLKIQKHENNYKTFELNKEKYKDRRYEISDDDGISHRKEDKEQYNRRINIVKESVNKCKDECPTRNYKFHSKPTDARNYKHNNKPMNSSSDSRLEETRSKENDNCAISENYNDGRNGTEIRSGNYGGNIFPKNYNDRISRRNTSNKQNKVKWNSNIDVSNNSFTDNSYNSHNYRQQNENVKGNSTNHNGKSPMNEDTSNIRNKLKCASNVTLSDGNKDYNNRRKNENAKDNYMKHTRGTYFENKDKKYNNFGIYQRRNNVNKTANQHYKYVMGSKNKLPTTTSNTNHIEQWLNKDNQCYDKDEENNQFSKPQIIHHIVRHEVKIIHAREKEKRNWNKLPRVFGNEYEKKEKMEKYIHFQNENEMKDWKEYMFLNPEDISWKINNQKTPEVDLKDGNNTENEGNTTQKSGQAKKYIRNLKQVKKISMQMLQSALNSVSDCNSEDNYTPSNAKQEVLQTPEHETFTKAAKIDEGYAYRIDTPAKSKPSIVAFTTKSNKLIYFGNEISYLVCGCHQALDIFLGIYGTEWIKARRNTIDILDNLTKEVLEKGKESRLKNFFKYIGIGGKIAGAAEFAGMVPKYVGITCTVVGQLAELLAKYCDVSTIQFNAKEFEMMKAFQHDVDASNDLYMYALQCDKQLQETKEFIDDFYHNIKRGDYNEVASELGLTEFFGQILHLEPSHTSFHRQIYCAMKSLSAKREESATHGALSRGFDEHPEEMVALKSLNWRCNIDAAENSTLMMGWEEVSILLHKTTASNKVEVVKKLQDCSRVLLQEERVLKNKVQLLSSDRKM